MVRVEFVDQSAQPTIDYVQGWPTVWVDIEVGFNRSGRAPNDVVAPKFKRCRAVVDVGSNHTIVDVSLTQGINPIRTVPGVNVGIRLYGDVYEALMLIVGLNDPVTLEIGSQDLMANGLPVPMLIGRDMLSRYKLTYDTPRNDFRLEHSPQNEGG